MKLSWSILCLTAALVWHNAHAEPAAPALDPKRIINDSYGFLKSQEPEMAADEYALYEKAVSLISVRPEFGLKLLESLVASGEHKSPAFELALGNVYYSSGKPDMAETYYRRAIGQLPDFQRAWNNLAALLYSQGRYAEAIPCFMRVVANGKGDANTLGVLAYCQSRAGNAVAAEMNYIQALGLDPDNPDWINGLLSLALESKQYGRAEMLLKQLIRLKPQDAHTWMLYATVLTNEGRPVEAIAALDSAASLGLVGDDGYLLLGDLCVEQKLEPEAIAAYRHAMAQSPDIGAKRLINYARALVATDSLPEAERALGGIRENLSAESQLLLLQTRAEIDRAKHDWPAAQRNLEAVLQLQPLDGPTLLTLGQVYKAQGNLTSADMVLEQAVRIPASAYRACLELGDIAVQKHHYQRAVEYLEKALALEKSAALQQYLAKLKLLSTSEEPQPSRS